MITNHPYMCAASVYINMNGNKLANSKLNNGRQMINITALYKQHSCKSLHYIHNYHIIQSLHLGPFILLTAALLFSFLQIVESAQNTAKNFSNWNSIIVANNSNLYNESMDDIDISQTRFPGTVKSMVFGWDEYIKIGLCVIAIIAALIGNFAVVVAIAVKSALRVTVNLYLANLAVADILICVFCMWVLLVNNLTTPNYVLGAFLCKLNGFAQMTCLTSSVLTLSAISCDRTMAIMFPLRSRVTKKRTDAVIAAIWLSSLAISTPFLIFRQQRTIQWSDYTETNCLEIWPSTSVYSAINFKRAYYTLVSSTLFFAPVVVMLTAYSAIIWKLWVNVVPGEAHFNHIQQQKKSKRKVIQMVVVVLLVFIICWLPLQCCVMYSLYWHSSDYGPLPAWFSNFSYYSTFIAYSNSIANPIIYGGFSPSFRDAIWSIVWKSRGKLERPPNSTVRGNRLSHDYNL